MKSREMKLCKKPTIHGQHKGTDNTKLVVEHALTQNLKVAQPLVTIKVTRFNVLSIYFPNKPSQDGSAQTTECMISSLFAVSKVDKGVFLSQNQVMFSGEKKMSEIKRRIERDFCQKGSSWIFNPLQDEAYIKCLYIFVHVMGSVCIFVITNKLLIMQK